MNKYAEHSKRQQTEQHRRRSCEGKRAYNSREEAYQKGQAAYLCKHCKRWHRSGAAATLAAKLARKMID